MPESKGHTQTTCHKMLQLVSLCFRRVFFFFFCTFYWKSCTLNITDKIVPTNIWIRCLTATCKNLKNSPFQCVYLFFLVFNIHRFHTVACECDAFHFIYMTNMDLYVCASLIFTLHWRNQSETSGCLANTILKHPHFIERVNITLWLFGHLSI